MKITKDDLVCTGRWTPEQGRLFADLAWQIEKENERKLLRARLAELEDERDGYLRALILLASRYYWDRLSFSEDGSSGIRRLVRAALDEAGATVPEDE